MTTITPSMPASVEVVSSGSFIADKFPVWRRKTAGGGMRLSVCENLSSPIVHLRLCFYAGTCYEPPGNEGVASLATPLLRAANTRRTNEEIERVTSHLGADVVSNVEWELGSLGITVLREDLDRALDLVFDLARFPRFSADHFETARRQRLAQLEHARRWTETLATDLLARILYGKSVYGNSLLGTQAGLQALTRDDLVDFHQRHFSPANGFLIAAGAVNLETLEKKLKPWVSHSFSRPFPEPASQAPKQQTDAKIYLLHLRDSDLTELRIGCVGIAQSHPEKAAMELVNGLLGGSPVSRLARSLRQKHGFTYFVHSRFVARRNPGPFFIRTSVPAAASAAATEEIFSEIERLRTDPISSEEIRAVQRYLKTLLLTEFESSQGTADALAHLETYHLDDDHFDRYLDQIYRVDASCIRRLASQYLRRERMVVVVVGRVNEVKHELARLGDIEEIDATD